MSQKELYKAAVEGMLFTWGQPLSLSSIMKVIDLEKTEAKELMDELISEYEVGRRGLRIRQIGKGYQLVTASEVAPFIERLCTPVKVRKLSQSALEVLAIIAYNQPVTKGEMEAVRGVRSDRVVEGLLQKGLIMEKGRADTVGRPTVYGTTDLFLEKFGFASIKELPELEDLSVLVSGEKEDEEDGEQLRIDIPLSGASEEV